MLSILNDDEARLSLAKVMPQKYTSNMSKLKIFTFIIFLLFDDDTSMRPWARDKMLQRRRGLAYQIINCLTQGTHEVVNTSSRTISQLQNYCRFILAKYSIEGIFQCYQAMYRHRYYLTSKYDAMFAADETKWLALMPMQASQYFDDVGIWKLYLRRIGNDVGRWGISGLLKWLWRSMPPMIFTSHIEIKWLYLTAKMILC